ncbi:MAG TPA: hypothetical protein PLP34_05870, partial [Chitinophagaceae bacterium]|nr:hypothetical protein [Chitinophagaceae bacterium]
DAKRMFDHELAFCDSLRINNYISFLVRDYMYYRLYKPFKIKPRLVWVTSATLPSDPKQYETFLSGRKNTFIINLPSVKIYHANQELRVETVIELYSGATQSVLLSEKTVGTPQTEITDYPLCSGNGWDCAFVNSVYPHFYSILRLIVEQQTTKK